MIDAYFMLDGPIDLTMNCRAAIVTGNCFLTRNICHILNTSVILERDKTRLARKEKCLEGNETRLARNETVERYF